MAKRKVTKLERIKKLIQANPKLKPVFAASTLIGILIIIYIANRSLDGTGISYAISYGVILGLFCGYLVQNNISNNVKFGTLGIFSGMGLDLIATSLSPDKGEQTINAINSIGAVIGNAAAKLFLENKLEENFEASSAFIQKNVTIGLWVFILVIGLVLIFANIFKPKEEAIA